MSQQLPQATSIDATISNCNLAALQSATLTVCVDHPAPAELSGELRLAGTVVAQFLLTDGQDMGNSCLAYSNLPSISLRQFVSNRPDLHGLTQLAGPWSVAITDTNPNSSNGHFVAWGLDIQGLR